MIYKACVRLSILSLLLVLTISPVIASGDEGQAPFVAGYGDATVANFINEVKYSGQSTTLMAEGTPAKFDIRTGRDDVSTGESGRKSPVKAFIYSAVLPGAGQLYTGSKTKAALFFGIEALAWTGHVVYHGKGKDNTDTYQSFANTHWLEGRYSAWLDEHWGVTDDEDAYDGEFLVFGHHLPDTRTQQYYEMIGKYNQFVYGWDDTGDIASSSGEPHPTTYSPLRIQYEGMRHDANKMYDRATASLFVMMANHLISGFEAALAARNHNKHTDNLAQRISLNAYTARSEYGYFPMLSMTYKF